MCTRFEYFFHAALLS